MLAAMEGLVGSLEDAGASILAVRVMHALPSAVMKREVELQRLAAIVRQVLVKVCVCVLVLCWECHCAPPPPLPNEHTLKKHRKVSTVNVACMHWSAVVLASRVPAPLRLPSPTSSSSPFFSFTPCGPPL